jgi:hypothetical protein
MTPSSSGWDLEAGLDAASPRRSLRIALVAAGVLAAVALTLLGALVAVTDAPLLGP